MRRTMRWTGVWRPRLKYQVLLLLLLLFILLLLLLSCLSSSPSPDVHHVNLSTSFIKSAQYRPYLPPALTITHVLINQHISIPPPPFFVPFFVSPAGGFVCELVGQYVLGSSRVVHVSRQGNLLPTTHYLLPTTTLLTLALLSLLHSCCSGVVHVSRQGNLLPTTLHYTINVSFSSSLTVTLTFVELV